MVIGVVVGDVVLNTSPAVIGWVFGLGMGLLGGAFVAAITSGEAIAGSGSTGGGSAHRGRRSAAPWLEPGGDDPKKRP